MHCRIGNQSSPQSPPPPQQDHDDNDPEQESDRTRHSTGSRRHHHHGNGRETTLSAASQRRQRYRPSQDSDIDEEFTDMEESTDIVVIQQQQQQQQSPHARKQRDNHGYPSHCSSTESITENYEEHPPCCHDLDDDDDDDDEQAWLDLNTFFSSSHETTTTTTTREGNSERRASFTWRPWMNRLESRQHGSSSGEATTTAEAPHHVSGPSSSLGAQTFATGTADMDNSVTVLGREHQQDFNDTDQRQSQAMVQEIFGPLSPVVAPTEGSSAKTENDGLSRVSNDDEESLKSANGDQEPKEAIREKNRS